MKIPRVMLIVPPGGYFAERWSGGSMMPALGIQYIAAVLETDGIDVEIVPSHVLDLSWQELARKIETDRPDVVGITTTTENRFLSFRVAETAKAAFPPALTVLGGPHLKNTARDTLAHVPAVDAVISGEGEETMRDLVRCLGAVGDLGRVAGLSFRRPDGTIQENSPRPLIADLNSLPLPARHLEPWGRYNFSMEVPGHGLLPAGNMMTSRGCPFTCKFCATPSNWGTKVRSLSPEKVVAEVEHLADRYGSRVIWFYDDTFNFSRARTAAICDLIIERRLGIKWFCEVRVDILNKSLFAKMVEAGLYHVGFGIESGSERICRDIITKKATLGQAYDVIEWCGEFGVNANPFFIFSHPTETWNEARETMSIIEDLEGKCETSVAILHVYPGTPLEERARAEGNIPKDFSWSIENDRRAIVLPAAQGHAPLYLDRLTWGQLCEIMVRFSVAKKSIRWTRKIPKVLGSIRSFGDVWRYFILFLTLIRFKAGGLVGIGAKRRATGRGSDELSLSRKVAI
ncbi:MAG: radical SAM protein [Nitrospirota bacterium]